MSKSYGNYVGITEAPQEMFGKLMSISDGLMWRYYELLTDVTVADIERMRRAVTSGELHPMRAKKNLAKKIIADFHSTDAAEQAEKNWEKQFQKDEVPEGLEVIDVEAPVRLDKLLVKIGLAASSSEAVRKIKEKSVRIDGAVQDSPQSVLSASEPLTVRLGKGIRRVRIVGVATKP
jgi:tyrosyl-tRNA synthetase